MSRRKWQGVAYFEVPEGMKHCIMTVCPGEPRQEGRGFLGLMKAAAEKLDTLIIIDAGDLGFHNFKRLIPQDLALETSRARSRKWRELNQPHIDATMGDRCQVIPMAELSKDSSYDDRSKLIRAIYDQGNNDVSQWFDYSINLDIKHRSARFAERGITIEPWAQRENSLDYLCDEYSLRSIMWEKWGLHEIYLGLAVRAPDFFQKHNMLRPDLDLTIPENHEITVIDLTPAQRLVQFPQKNTFPEPKRSVA